jgi:putative DNA primase/helicase
LATQTEHKIHLKHDGDVQIATGKNRKSTNWVNQTVKWSKLVDLVTRTKRTPEIFAEYMAMSKDRQDAIKDVGGFVGGSVRNGRRGRNDIIHRTVIALDVDHGTNIQEVLDNFSMIFGCAFVWYTTHKHHPKKPRFRILIPLTRAVTPDEYEAISRKIAGIIGIEVFDDTTYEVNRLMYYPSTSDDGEFLKGYVDEAWMNPDEVLDMYTDWKNRAEWPQSSRETKKLTEAQKTQQDPRDKKGVIGAFCRTYDIHDAIAMFLADRYEQVADNRYTFAEGTTSGGMVTFDDLYAFSFHSTDPIQGQLCNAFDLVRLHLFGELDKDKQSDETDKLPSYKAMVEFAGRDTRTRDMMEQERQQEIDAQFDVLPEDITDEQREALFFNQDGKFIPRYMADWYLYKKHAFVLREELYLYSDGTFRNSEDDFKLKTTLALKDDFVTRRLSETMNYIKNTMPKVSPDEATSMGDYLNVKNGLIKLSTMEFTEHTPELRTIMQLPVAYDPSADCPALKEFLKKVTFDECVPIIQEMFGYCLLNTMQYEKSFLLYGEGQNGKGTLIAVMQHFFGEANTSNVALQTLSDNRFAAASLFGKMVNLHSDIPNRLIEDTSLFKELTSGDRIQAEEKHKAAFSFNNRAKLVFSANELPSSRDNSDGFHRRWVIVPFPNKFNDRELRSNLFSDLEMSGILNWAIEGLKRLIKQGGFTESKIVREKVQDYREKSDSVYHFLRERCEIGGPNDTVKKQDLYNAYRSVCTDWGVHPVNQANFNQRVRVVYPMVYEYRHGKSRLWRHLIHDRQQEIDDDFLA